MTGARGRSRLTRQAGERQEAPIIEPERVSGAAWDEAREVIGPRMAVSPRTGRAGCPHKLVLDVAEDYDGHGAYLAR